MQLRQSNFPAEPLRRTPTMSGLGPVSLLERMRRALDGRCGVVSSSAASTEPPPLDASFRERLPLEVLIVEDNALNLKVARAMFARLGYETDSAGNGVEALQALVRKRYDVVLMDVQMPVMDGLAATRQIRARFGAGSAPRVIAMTAADSPAEREQCRAVGMEDFLVKPVRLDAIAAALTRAVGAQERQAAFDLEVLARALETRGEPTLATELANVAAAATAALAALATLVASQRTADAAVAADDLARRAGEIGALALARDARALAQELASGAVQDGETERLLAPVRRAAHELVGVVATALGAEGSAPAPA